MQKSIVPSFLYPYWTKALGGVTILFGLIVFFHRLAEYQIMDFAGLSFPLAMGLVMIFFSREKVYDERIAYLKFRSLAAAVPLGATATMLINYIQNYEGYSIETDSWYSISAFEYLSITLIIAIGWFQYLRVKE
ncbi:hypothetical protein [uncultured Imperialibacter sp.]|jgi:hypothetical protein|uniref:hypothetical protein n=1 Tax=uncultured Imperialibacter sp. TaxID=1672639 RepID=UPI0030D9D02F|tara:strand:- start:11826 stop:12227 length:402 start_codon:yes stop_codon:yes gene_type:complete